MQKVCVRETGAALRIEERIPCPSRRGRRCLNAPRLVVHEFLQEQSTDDGARFAAHRGNILMSRFGIDARGILSPKAAPNFSSVRGEAGSIIGGLFLQEFVNDKPWVHLDIAGPAWTDKEFFFYSQGGTGFPVTHPLHYLLNF